jgi:hypothetical protein
VRSHSLAVYHSSVSHFPMPLMPECVRGGPQNGVKRAFAGVRDAETAPPETAGVSIVMLRAMVSAVAAAYLRIGLPP